MASSYSTGHETVARHFANLAQGLRDLKIGATIGTAVPYAVFVHEGTRAHDIVPRNARALFWAGATHPVGRVHHPGTQANPWLRQVFDARRNAIIKGVADGLEDAIREGEFHAAAGFAEAMRKTLELAQEQAPVRTGALRASLHTDFFNR